MTAPNAVDQPFRRLFAGFDRDVEPPADLATRLRLRVLAEAELDAPIAPQPAPTQLRGPIDLAPPFRDRRPSSDTARAPEVSSVPVPRPMAAAPRDELARRRRQPWYLVAAEIAAVVLLLMGAAVVIIQRTVDVDRSAPRLGSAVTAVAGPSGEPQLLWERTDPDLQGNGDFDAGDDTIVRLVQDVQKSGFLWFEQYEYTSYLQSLDRRIGEQRWLIPVDGYGTSYVTPAAVLYVSYPTQEDEATSLIAFSRMDGSQMWRSELRATPVYLPDLAVRDNLVYLPTDDATVRAYDLTTGGEVWATSIGDPPGPGTTGYVAAGDLTLDGDRLLTLDPSGAVVELDAASGGISARHAVSTPLPTVVYGGRLLVTPDRLVTVVTGTDEEIPEGDYSVENQPAIVTRVSAIDRITGAPAWTDEIAGSSSVVYGADGRMVVESYGAFDESLGGEPITIRVLDLRSGDELWEQDQPMGTRQFTVEGATTGDGQLLLGNDQAGELIALDIDTGTELWRYKVGNVLMTSPFVTGAMVIVGDRPDHLLAIEIPENE